MRTSRILLSVGCVGAIALGTLVPAKAQYYYPPPGYGGPPPGYGYRGADPNGCPPGYTLQGGNCAPYRGPRGGGYGYYRGADPAGCPPGYSLQVTVRRIRDRVARMFHPEPAIPGSKL
jgi:hypothetical protein